jgi:hypothetical protein
MKSDSWVPIPGYEGLYEFNTKHWNWKVRNAKTKEPLDPQYGVTYRLSRDGVRKHHHINAISRAVATNVALVP